MKVLFVSSGNLGYSNGISPIVKNQGDSLIKYNIQVDYFTIKNRGVFGYLKHIPSLRKHLSGKEYDIVHAHYLYSAIIAGVSSKIPVVASLMGSDVTEANLLWRIIIKVFYKYFWCATIVKSNKMSKVLNLKNLNVVPNGVDFSVFKPMGKSIAKSKVGLNSKKHILFIADPDRPEKNVQLARNAVEQLNSEEIELNIICGVPMSSIPIYLNAGDVLLLTSNFEGSPNVIKEAMACNLPIVSTDVGDVKDVINDIKGCYIASYDTKDVAEKLKMALKNKDGTTGRRTIQHLDSTIIAKKIYNIYSACIV